MLVKVDLYSKQKKVEVNAIDLIKQVKDALNLQQHITSAVYGTLPNQDKKKKVERPDLDTKAKKDHIMAANISIDLKKEMSAWFLKQVKG